MNEKSYIIAIDGPVAAGKGTIAVRLAHELNGLYLYTGAMYRCVALFCLEKDIELTNAPAVAEALSEVSIRFVGDLVFLNEKDVTDRIKEHDAANGSSVVAVFPEVRKALVIKQQQIAQEALAQGKVVVSEGRDTGIAVFPEAAVKVFLTATEEVRAKRRLLQYQSKGEAISFETILEEIRARDKRDKGRDLDPLPSNPEQHGYVVLDDSLLSEEETFARIREELQKKELL